MNDSDEALKQHLHAMPIVPPSTDFDARIIANAHKETVREKNIWALITSNWFMPKPAFVLVSVMVFGVFVGWEGVSLLEYQTTWETVDETLVSFMYEGENN